MLKGWMILSLDPQYCYHMTTNIPGVKVITLEEDFSEHPELDPKLNSNVIFGTNLLPSPEVMWAMVDGEELKFNSLYYEHLMRPDIVEFIYTLIGYIYKGGNIIIYTTSINEAIKYLIDFFEKAYGIHIGTSESNMFRFDDKCIPMWAIGVYSLGIITPYEFLKLFPQDATIPTDIYTKLIIDINPYSSMNNYYEKVAAIDQIRLNNVGKMSQSAIHTIG